MKKETILNGTGKAPTDAEMKEGWAAATLEDIGDLYCGQSPATQFVNTTGEGTPYITGPDQWDGNELHVDKWTTDPRRTVPDGCIFVTVKGAGVGTIFPGVRGAIGRDIYAFEPAVEVHESFVQRALECTVSEIKRNAAGDIPGLSKGHLLKHRVSLPPREEQKRIITAVDHLFVLSKSARDHLSQIPVILKRFRQAVLSAACSGRLTDDWRAQLRQPRSSGREFADLLWKRRLGESSKAKSWPMNEVYLQQAEDIPDNWYWESLSRCTDVRDGTHDSPKYQRTGVSLVTSKNLVHNGIDFRTAKFISPEDHLQIAKRSAVENGDVLFAMIGTIGNPTIVDCDRSFSIKNVALFRTLGDRVLSRWLSIWLESSHATRIFQEFAKGSTQPFVPLNVFRSLPVPLPPPDELRQIITRVDQLLGHAQKVKEHFYLASGKIDKLTQCILAKAFRGELIPTEAELARREGREYEPASVLLERIRTERANQAKTSSGPKPKIREASAHG